MAEPVLVGSYNPDDLGSIDALDGVLRGFEPGQLGQIDLPLDPEIAADPEYSLFLQATEQLNNELYVMGLTNWPDLPQIAFLYWDQRMVRILFQATQSSASSYSQSPSVIWATVFRAILTAAGSRVGSNAAFQRFAATRGYNIMQAGGAAARLRNLQQGRLAYKSGVRARSAGTLIGSLPSLRFMLIAGSLLFFAIAPAAFLRLFMWPIKEGYNRIIKPTLAAIADAAKDVAGKAASPVLFIAGGLLVVGGAWMMMKPKVGL